MLTLIVDSDGEFGAKSGLLLRQIEVWLAARGIDFCVLPATSPELPATALAATALVAVGAGADGGAPALSRFLRQVPDAGLAGKPFLWVRSATAAGDGDPALGTFWRALQRAGIDVLLGPVVLRDWPDRGDVLSERDHRSLRDGLLTVTASLDFCRRLSRMRASLDLAERFAIARCWPERIASCEG